MVSVGYSDLLVLPQASSEWTTASWTNYVLWLPPCLILAVVPDALQNSLYGRHVDRMAVGSTRFTTSDTASASTVPSGRVSVGRKTPRYGEIAVDDKPGPFEGVGDRVVRFGGADLTARAS